MTDHKGNDRTASDVWRTAIQTQPGRPADICELCWQAKVGKCWS